MKRALITGVTGQDGSYLAELLLAKGYEVHGIIRRSRTSTRGRIDHSTTTRTERDAEAVSALRRPDRRQLAGQLIEHVQPDEIYNLGAQSHVRVSLRQPGIHGRRRRASARCGCSRPSATSAHRRPSASTRRRLARCSARSREVPQTRDDAVLSAQPLRLRQGLRLLDHGELPRGLRPVRLQRHPLQPRSPAPRRDLRHAQDHARGRRASRRAAARSSYLGNLDAKRDWGFARDYVEAMWLMLQQDKPDDYVIATGENAQRARVSWIKRFQLGRPGLEAVCRNRPALPAAGRGGLAARRSVQGAQELGWQPTHRTSTSLCASWSKLI